jgi:DNA-binding MarR family transcriptional regulator
LQVFLSTYYPAGVPNQDQAHAADELARVMSQLTRRLRAASGRDALTPSQVSVLGRLHRRGPATTAAIARDELVRPQSMRTTLAALEARGLVTRAPHPTDGRQTLFSLSDTGARLHGPGGQARHGWLAEALESELSPAERRVVAEAIPLLRRLVGS